jgi:hypothetical protein
MVQGFCIASRRLFCPGSGFYLFPFLIQQAGFCIGKSKRSGNVPVEEGDWKIPQAEAEFSMFINNRLSHSSLIKI